MANIVEYRTGRMSLRRLQDAVWTTAESVASIDEKEFYKYLMNVEGDLEIATIGVNPDENAKPILDDLDARLRAELGTNN